MLSITIDWLSVNFKEWTNEAKRFVRTYASSDPVQNTTPRFGYSVATVDNNGVVVQWNTDRSDMGYHVIFSGSTLRHIFSRAGVQPEALLHATINAGGNISRLDLAKDATGKAIDLQAIYQSLEQGNNRGTARTYGRITSNGGGDTIYVGSRQSEKFIRIYDKAAQTGSKHEAWYRFEVETKGMVARALAVSLDYSGNWAGCFDTIVKAMVDMPKSTDYEAFFQQGVVPIGLPKLEKQTDREKWVRDQVIPAVAKHYIDNPYSEAVARLIATLQLIDRQRKE